MKKILVLIISLVLGVSSFAEWKVSGDSVNSVNKDGCRLFVTKGYSKDEYNIGLIIPSIKPLNSYGDSNVKVIIDGHKSYNLIGNVRYDLDSTNISFLFDDNRRTPAIVEAMKQSNFEIKFDLDTPMGYETVFEISDFAQKFKK